MTFTYQLALHTSNKLSTVTVPFTPYTNQLGAWNSDITGWVSPDNSVSVVVDANRKLFGASMLNFVLGEVPEGTIYKDFDCSPNTDYMISCYVRNNGVLTTGLRVGTATDWSSNYFCNRLITVVNSGANTKLRINLDLCYASDSMANVWVGGLFLIPISASEALMSIEALSLKYVYVVSSKNGPSAKDLINHKFHGSPFEYFLTMDGKRIGNYNQPLIDLGVDENTLLKSHINELPVQLFYSFIDSVALMTMLEGDISRVSHTFPKMNSGVIDMKLFPRVQYFMGFEVSSARADGKPLANNATVSINIYVPITKVTNSVQDSMISTIITALMGELGFSAIRGSDYFREPEQLYVRQTQYIKDVQVTKRHKA